MLSYQHGYHAGNFADILKHTVLMRLLGYMTQKDKPLFYLETHSGKGLYDLRDKQSLKTKEYLKGIELIWQVKDQLPAVFSEYLAAIQDLNTNQSLRYYPGSPALAIHSLRNQDRLYCCELHPAEFELLNKIPKQGKRVFFSQADGIEQLNAVLPPPEKRGLVFIDPSYEIKSEYRDIPAKIKSAYNHFKSGTFCLWYPIVDKKLHEQLLRGMNAIGADKNLRFEFQHEPLSSFSMTGCGVWVINPPYTLRDEVSVIGKSLAKILNPGVSRFLVEY